VVHLDEHASASRRQPVTHGVRERLPLLGHVRAGHRRAGQIVERARAGQASVVLGAVALLAAAMHARALTTAGTRTHGEIDGRELVAI